MRSMPPSTSPVGSGLRALVLVACASSPAAPAQIFVVDANNGPGTHFTSIAAAAAAVPSGSVLQVRTGNYQSVTITGKALTILGEPGAHVFGFSSVLSISGTAANQAVHVRGLTLTSAFGGVVVACAACQGPVVLERVVQSTQFLPGTAYGELRIAQCDHVLLTECGLFVRTSPPAAVTIVDSDVVITRCKASASGTAVDVANSTLQLVECQVTGATGSNPTVRLASSAVRMVGPSWLHSSGPLAFGGTGTVVLDSAVSIVGGIGANVAVTTRPQARVVATNGALGTTAAATLQGPPGHLAVLCLGALGPPVSVPGVQFEAWLLPGSFVPVAAAVLTPTAPSVAFGVVVPSNPLLLGTACCWQGLTYAATVGFELTPPAPFLP